MVVRDQLDTPLPSSSTDYLPSSPTLNQAAQFIARVDIDGSWLSIGRSSLLSDLVLPSSNKLISRVHAKIRYSSNDDAFEVSCPGFNGLRLSIAGQSMSLCRESSVMITLDSLHDLEIDIMGARIVAVVSKQVDGATLLPSSPVLSQGTEIHALSPLPSPLGVLTPGSTPVKDTDVLKPRKLNFGEFERIVKKRKLLPGKENIPPGHNAEIKQSTESMQHSLMPFTSSPTPCPAQITGSESTQESTHTDPVIPERTDTEPAYQDSTAVSTEPGPVSNTDQIDPEFIDMILTSLASSTISPSPLSHLSPFFPSSSSPSEIESFLRSIPCISEVSRVGKDAAGQALRSTWFYEPTLDADRVRRMRLGALMKPVRKTRKQHVQYYWKPVHLKTPVPATGLLPLKRKNKRR